MDNVNYSLTSEESVLHIILDSFSIDTNMPMGMLRIDPSLQSGYHMSITYPAMSRNHWSPFCAVLGAREEGLKACNEDYIKNIEIVTKKRIGTLLPCHLGLWNIFYPLYIDDNLEGVLIAGQRRLTNKKVSIKTMRTSLSKTGLDNAFIRSLEHLFMEVPICDHSDFYGPTLEHVKEIAELVLHLVGIRLVFEYRITNLTHEWLSLTQLLTNASDHLVYQLEQLPQRSQYNSAVETANDIRALIQLLVVKAENVRHSLLSHGDIPYAFRQVPLILFLNNIIARLRPVASMKDIELHEVNNAGTEKKVEIAEPYLTRAFTNLYDNAIKYSHFGTKKHSVKRYVRTTIKWLPDMSLIKISNCGIGITLEEIERVREQGVRGSLSYDRNRTGSGLGLSEAIKIIEKHNGKLEIESRKMADLDESYLTDVKVYLPYSQ